MRCKVAPGKKIYFQGRDRVEGEIIDIPDKEARLNISLGRCIGAEAERPLRVADPRPVTRAVTAEEEPQASLLTDGDADKPARGRRTYRRSDMKAED